MRIGDCGPGRQGEIGGGVKNANWFSLLISGCEACRLSPTATCRRTRPKRSFKVGGSSALYWFLHAPSLRAQLCCCASSKAPFASALA
jgi:hypothetical protein